MVHLAGGYLFDYKQMRRWAARSGVVLPKDDGMIALEIRPWFERMGWKVFDPMYFDWPRASKQRGVKAEPKIMLVLHQRNYPGATRKRHRVFKKNEVDEKVGRWLENQDVKVPWVTIPDPWGVEEPDDEDDDPPRGLFEAEWKVEPASGSQRKTAVIFQRKTEKGSRNRMGESSQRETRNNCKSQRATRSSSQQKITGGLRGDSGGDSQCVTSSSERETRGSTKRKAEAEAAAETGTAGSRKMRRTVQRS